MLRAREIFTKICLGGMIVAALSMIVGGLAAKADIKSQLAVWVLVAHEQRANAFI